MNVVVLDNPSAFNNPFQFEITFECIEDLQEDLEWKIIYVGSAESEEYDQVLDSVFVGPVPEGRHMFVFEADPPDSSKIPVQDAVGVTVVLLTCSYRGKEFIRVGYYVNNSYIDPELVENPPATPQYDKLQRNILATNPRVTRFKIEWDDNQSQQQSSGQETGCQGEGDAVVEETSTASSGPIPLTSSSGPVNGKSHSVQALSQDQNHDHNNQSFGDHSRDSSSNNNHHHHRSNDNHSNSQPQALEA